VTQGRPLTIFFDGGCRPNPGPMRAAAVARGKIYLKPDLGPGTSEQAEWSALIHALEVAASLGARDIILAGDCRSVVDRANKRLTRARPDLAPLLARFEALSSSFDRVRVRYIRRTQNLAGIALEADTR
jgi:ribonuclease HI